MPATPNPGLPNPFDNPTPAMLAVGLGIQYPQQLSVKDPAVVAAITWLTGIGAPPPIALDSSVGIPGGAVIPNNTLTFTMNGMSLVFSAGLTAVRPGETAMALYVAGFILGPDGKPLALPVGFESQVPMPYQAAVLYPQNPASPVLVQTSPIGPPVMPPPNNTGVGCNFNSSATDSLGAHPIGSMWNEDGKGPWNNPAGQYQKGPGVELFGPATSWKRLS